MFHVAKLSVPPCNTVSHFFTSNGKHKKFTTRLNNNATNYANQKSRHQRTAAQRKKWDTTLKIMQNAAEQTTHMEIMWMA